MIKKILPIALLALPIAANAFTVDLRGGYRSGSHSYETRLKVANGWQSGWWASLETDSMNDTHSNNSNPNANEKTGKDVVSLNYNELETNYTFKLNDQWQLKPGMLTHWSSDGTRFGPYLKLSYDMNKQLNLAVRYRYDYNVYRSNMINTDGVVEHTRGNQHRGDTYVTYKINDKYTASWQSTIYSYQHNLRYNNHKRWATENAFVLQYQATPMIAPYIEYDYLDKQGEYNGEDNLAENSYRVGVTMTF